MDTAAGPEKAIETVKYRYRSCVRCGASNELMRPIHNRMPVILRREDEEQWLDVSRALFEKARSVLKPYSAELMDAHDVSTLVNKPENDSSECIQPDSGGEIFTPQLPLL